MAQSDGRIISKEENARESLSSSKKSLKKLAAAGGPSASQNLSVLNSDLKTFIKVGPMTTDQSKSFLFIIEWTPNTLPVMKLGEMKILFEFGLQRDGKVEH